MNILNLTMATEERKPYSKCIKISVTKPEISQESGAQFCDKCRLKLFILNLYLMENNTT